MKKLEIVTTIKGQVFDTYVKPASAEKTNAKTGEVYQAQPEKYYLQFISEKVLNKDTGENKKQIVDVKVLVNPAVYEDKIVEISVNVFNMGMNTYYNQVDDTKIIVK
ncbi:MAG: hypothetical protein QM495_12820 [Lutibacter sp.]|uniref:hypothetical protein n=1 Tax=Lutibacter sp. TaxID=1925666 RepID=UPI00385FB0A9